MNSTQIQFNTKTRFFTIATAGHVDHGKTSLLRILTGIDPDRLKEEKERQMTTDLGFAYLPLGELLVVGFVDVPGHGKFLKNMLAGVGGIDMALLVVAADEGPMPQTRQHVRILSLLGISRAVVALSKTDLVADQDHMELVKEEIEQLLKAHNIETLAICPVSSQTGAGIDELKTELSKQLTAIPAHSLEGSLLLPVDRVFSKSGFGTVITGTLVRGKVAVGDQIFVEPGSAPARVRRLETHGQSINEAHPGQRVACNLVLKEEQKLKRGLVLCSRAVQPARTLIVSLYDRPRILKQTLSERLSDQPIRLYHGTAEYQGYLRWVEDCPGDPGLNAGEQTGIGFLALNDDAVLSALDKFVLRLTDDTIYGGTILFKERPRWLSKGEVLKLADLLEHEKFQEALRLFLDDSPQLMLKEAQLAAVFPELLQQSLLREAAKDSWLRQLGDYLISAESLKELSSRLVQTLRDFPKAEESAGEGFALDSVRQKLQPKLERAAFNALIEEETGGGRLLRRGDRLSLPGAESSDTGRPRFLEAESKVKDALSKNWCLEFDEIAEQSGLDLKTVKAAVQTLVKNKELIIASYDFVASKEKINEAHQILSDLWYAKRSIAPTDFKERLGVSRKYAMALLQYFDDVQITRRLDSGRVLLKGPARS